MQSLDFCQCGEQIHVSRVGLDTLCEDCDAESHAGPPILAVLNIRRGQLPSPDDCEE